MTQQHTWADILALTDQMRELALAESQLPEISDSILTTDNILTDQPTSAEPWQTISALERQRFQLLQQFFKEPISADDAPQIEKDINYLLQSDQQIQLLSQQLKKQLGKTFSNIGKARHASSAYSSVKQHK